MSLVWLYDSSVGLKTKFDLMRDGLRWETLSGVGICMPVDDMNCSRAAAAVTSGAAVLSATW